MQRFPNLSGRWRAFAGQISRSQMVWLFGQSSVSWMREPSLNRQLPLLFRFFAAYCKAYHRMTSVEWVVGGKQLLCALASVTRRLRLQDCVLLHLPDCAIYLDLLDPRFIKVVNEVSVGAADTAVLGALLSQGDTFIDVGANHGSFSVAAARLLGAKGVIVAVEPQPRLAELVNKTLALNAKCAFFVHPIAVGDRSESLPFFVCRNNSGESGLFCEAPEDFGHRVIVRVEQFDAAVDWRNLPGRIVVKVDVEGSEYAFISGARRMLSERRPIVMMELNADCMRVAGVSWNAMQALLTDLGYCGYAEVRDPMRVLPLTALDPTVKRNVLLTTSH